MFVTGSNPLSTQDDVAAALVQAGLNVFAWYDATPEEYEAHIRRVLEVGPNIIIDDGGDLVNLMHTEYTDLIPNVIGGCEETTTGILRLIQLNNAKALKFPMMLVNNADCKHLFDNRYGTGQSVWDGINRTTNQIVAGKNVVVAGYGWCGKGVAMRAKGLGAEVIVTEVDPIKAMEAVTDGFKVMKMEQAASVGDIFVTVTGCDAVIVKEHFLKMKDGAICCNAGHFDCEVDVAGLREIAKEAKPARKNIIGYTLENGNEIWMARLNEDLSTIVEGTERFCIGMSQDWKKVWPSVNEGPSVIERDGVYYMTYSANSYESPAYGVGVATASSPEGPWVKYDGNPVLQFCNSLEGVGHHALFKDAKGKDRIVFHSHNRPGQIHPRIIHIGHPRCICNRWVQQNETRTIRRRL